MAGKAGTAELVLLQMLEETLERLQQSQDSAYEGQLSLFVGDPKER